MIIVVKEHSMNLFNSSAAKSIRNQADTEESCDPTIGLVSLIEL
jgi:hypothetical protein